MQAIERIRAALNAASCGPWIGAGPSFGRPLPEYLDSVVQDCGDGDRSIAICRDTETSDASYIAACNPAAMTEVLAHIDKLEAENEQLRKNAERYQWLRSRPIFWAPFGHEASAEKLDSGIDAAMKLP